jgi:hypothetical protein
LGAGKPGHALTLFTPDDVHYLRMLAPVIRQAGGTVEPWMLAMKRERSDKKKKCPPSLLRHIKVTSLNLIHVVIL